EVACVPVVPVAPDVVQATCANGVVTVPSVTPPQTAGIVYTVVPGGPYDGTVDTEVMVTATVLNDHGWGQVSAPWVRVDADTAELTVELVAASCDEVTPAAPSVTQALCRGGVVGDAAVTVGPTDDITYTFSASPAYAEGQ